MSYKLLVCLFAMGVTVSLNGVIVINNTSHKAKISGRGTSFGVEYEAPDMTFQGASLEPGKEINIWGWFEFDTMTVTVDGECYCFTKPTRQTIVTINQDSVGNITTEQKE